MTGRMRAEAQAFLDCLYDEQRDAATFPFTDDERFRWQYTPGPRNGLSLQGMEPVQRERAMSLVDSALSASGAETVRGLLERGHDVEVSGAWTLGRVSAVAREPDGLLKAGANPRGMQGYAVGR